MTNMERMAFSNNRISDISPIAGLAGIEDLAAIDNPIDDWTPVAHISDVYGRPK
jgi:Leucine-rich repeat (LRR) protein